MLGWLFLSGALLCPALLTSTHTHKHPTHTYTYTAKDKQNLHRLFSIQSHFQLHWDPLSRTPSPESPRTARLSDKTPQTLLHYEAVIGGAAWSNVQTYTETHTKYTNVASTKRNPHTPPLICYQAFSETDAWATCALLKHNPLRTTDKIFSYTGCPWSNVKQNWLHVYTCFSFYSVLYCIWRLPECLFFSL